MRGLREKAFRSCDGLSILWNQAGGGIYCFGVSADALREMRERDRGQQKDGLPALRIQEKAGFLGGVGVRSHVRPAAGPALVHAPDCCYRQPYGRWHPHRNLNIHLGSDLGFYPSLGRITVWKSGSVENSLRSESRKDSRLITFVQFASFALCGMSRRSSCRWTTGVGDDDLLAATVLDRRYGGGPGLAVPRLHSDG